MEGRPLVAIIRRKVTDRIRDRAPSQGVVSRRNIIHEDGGAEPELREGRRDRSM